MKNWKEITQRLVSLHNKKESAVIRLTPHSKGEMVNLSSDEFCLEIEGKELQTKKVRRFLWENRKKRALLRSKAVIWSAYIEEDDKTYVGVGALTSKRVMDKMAQRNG